MKKILVRTTQKETGRGVANLLVVAYDADSKLERVLKEENPPAPELAGALSTSKRIGSVLTDDNGMVELSLSGDDLSTPGPFVPPGDPVGGAGLKKAKTQLAQSGEKGNNLKLVVVVLAPEGAARTFESRLLYVSKEVRKNAGAVETYNIELTTEQLQQAQIPLPQNDHETSSTERKIKQHKKIKRAQKAFRKGIKEFNEEIEKEEKKEREEIRKTVKEAILPDMAILNSMYNFVKESDSIAEVQGRVHKKGVDRFDEVLASDESNPEPGKGIKINLYLTYDEKAELAAFKFDFQGKDYFNIPENIIQKLLFKREKDEGINTILFSNNPISKFCIEKSIEEKCAEVHTGLDTAADDEETPEDPVDTNGSTGMVKADIPIYLEKLLYDKNANPFPNNGQDLAKRPDAKSVQDNVGRFKLQKGPADATAFYDFHSLQIAFQHVWHQLLDETLVNLSEKVHYNLENAGKKGLWGFISKRRLRQKASPTLMVAAANDAENQETAEIPTDISAAFDISFEEYDALNNNDKERLLTISEYINVKELKPAYATQVFIKRDQGERILDNIRVNKPFSTNQLLKELQERLLAKYEFTVFAANKDYHSINFGVMNTFRQKWEPLSYQAGKLVKTIPLSPNEERKYSVKTSQKIKATRKQAQKYNSTIESEMSSKSRAEAEIVSKAHDKSNFNMSISLDYSKVKSEVSFGKEAAKDSSQSKKDFREAVIKAAQEYKEERSIEINTEESFESEFNESGTIVNPNDELSVTYLFYELQRRYRVSEQLYRVMPVVMVAQQVPSPDQITEAWLIANDWILNRVLLDDSFRKTLQYIAQKNVGDDFAIRELRKNLRQQRTLVNNLQIEFSKLNIAVENKYAAIQESTSERIEEEHDKRFYKRWWWGWNSDQETPPDPEMAKAIEQAAEEDHKHAVEQAQKMAMAVQRETNTLHQLTTDYNATMREHLDILLQTRRLITHIKDNILYYMQNIWEMEPPDQRYMRLFKVKIPHFEADRTCIVASEPVEDIFAQFREDGKLKYNAWIHGKVKRKENGNPDVTYKQLVEVADMDTILGFKGNYMIFPLKEHNALTEFMAAPYIDDAFDAMDPDELSNINLEEYSRYICCLHDQAPEEFERLKPVLKKWLEKLLSDPLRNGDEIIVPTDSLFIEMLPSDETLLEDFKLQHREWDVKKVEAEVQEMKIENIRLAARLIEGQLEDPDIEKKIVIEGNSVQPVLNVGEESAMGDGQEATSINVADEE